MKELQSQTELVMLGVVKIGNAGSSSWFIRCNQAALYFAYTKEGSPRSFKERCSWWGRNSDTESWEGAESQIKPVFRCTFDTFACLISYYNILYYYIKIIFVFHGHSKYAQYTELRRSCKRRQPKSQCWRKVLQRWKVWSAVPVEVGWLCSYFGGWWGWPMDRRIRRQGHCNSVSDEHRLRRCVWCNSCRYLMISCIGWPIRPAILRIYLWKSTHETMMRWWHMMTTRRVYDVYDGCFLS